MYNSFNTQANVALKILKDELNITPIAVTRFTTGYCHSVYHVKTESDEAVLRVTSKENKRFYDGSIKWLNELALLETPIPKILKYGQYDDVYYTLITYICGKDIGEVYHTLTNYQKHDIVKEVVEIQRKVSTLPSNIVDGSGDYSVATCVEGIKDRIRHSRESIIKNKVFDSSVCDAVASVLDTLKDYFANINPTAYLDDISTKNILIHNGKLAGIVDIDEMGYGDSLEVIGFMNMALLAMNTDTKFVEYWLDEVHANFEQRKAVTFYTLLSCIGFMGERGMTFDNDNAVPVNQDEVDLFNAIYEKLLTML